MKRDLSFQIRQINRNIISAAQVINIICETQPFSVMGLSLLHEDMKTFFKRMKKKTNLCSLHPIYLNLLSMVCCSKSAQGQGIGIYTVLWLLNGGNKVNLKKTLPDQFQYRTDTQIATNRQSNGFALQRASGQKNSWFHIM